MTKKGLYLSKRLVRQITLSLLPLSLLISYSVTKGSGQEWWLTSSLLPSEPWRLVSYTWVHHSSSHLWSNIAIMTGVLWGLSLYRSAGWVLLTFIAGTAMGGALFVALSWSTQASLVGASAGIASLLSYALLLALSHRSWHYRLWGLTAVGGLDLLTLPSVQGYAMACHLMGYAVGIAIWWGEKRFVRKKSRNLAFPDSTALLNKAKQSGYLSLTDSEREELRAMEERGSHANNQDETTA